MKRLLLLLGGVSIGMAAGAQERQMNMFQTDASLQDLLRTNKTVKPLSHHDVANKTTATGSRWYSYASYLDTTQILLGFQTAFSSQLLWNDTTAKLVSSTVNRYNNMVSMGAIFDPSSVSFNDNTIYPGEMKVGPTNAYTVDQVEIFGVYGFNKAKTNVKDTIRLSWVKGLGGASSSDDIFSGSSLAGGGHYGTASFLEMRYDSVTNRARPTVGTLNVQDIILDNSTATPAWGDTSVNGVWSKTVTLNTPLAVAANGFSGMSISFISGDASFPAVGSTPVGDTVWNAAVDTYKYNMFRPLTAFPEDLSENILWAPYSVTDSNAGYFKSLPNSANGWTNVFVPQWAWSSGSGASTLQTPMINWHVTCPACGTIIPVSTPTTVKNIASVKAYPSPANSEVNIAFSVNDGSEVAVSLTNVLGQVVAAHTFSNVTIGKATINTATMSAGVYIYTVSAGGERTTGRIVVAH